MMSSAITKDPDILGGEPVFSGTRVPFKVLTDYLEGGDTLDQFLDQYPSVTRDLAIAALEETRLNNAIRAKIRRGIEQLDRGEGIPDDQLESHLAKLRANLE